MHLLGNLAYPLVLLLALAMPFVVQARMQSDAWWLHVLDALLLLGSTGALVGFYFVAAEGEKYVSNHISVGGFLITSSYDSTRSISASVDPCSTGGGVASLVVFDLALGGGFFSAVVSADQGRKIDVGGGISGDPTISVSKGSAMIFIKTSSGTVFSTAVPDLGSDEVELVYWRQRF